MVSRDPVWDGRRVLVTGHTGFKGAWFCLMLARLGARIHGLALDPVSGEALFRAARVDSLLEQDYRCDIRDAGQVREALRASEPEVVFHFAAQALVLPSYHDPLETFEVNTQGTANLLAAASDQLSVRGLVLITTDKVYENLEDGRRFVESDPLGGHDPYSASKAAAELVAASWRRSFAARRRPPVAIATARAGNVIGGGDWAPHRLFPDCVRAFMRDEPVRLRNPDSVRPWQHVLDPLAGYLSLGSRLLDEGGSAWAGSWNFGPGGEEVLSVRRMAELAAASWGAGARHEEEPVVSSHHEAAYLRLDSSKAHCRLGWRQRWNATRAIAETIGWYRDYSTGGDARSMCLSQIEAHEGSR